MRKLAPMFIATSVLTLAAGNALALGDMHKHKNAPSTATTSSTDSTITRSDAATTPPAASPTPPAASPTVPPNTQNPQGMSYSDKAATEPGTNARMDSNSTPSYSGSGTSTAPERTAKSTDATSALASDDKHALSRQAEGEKSTIAAEDTTTMKHHTAKKKAKKKVAKNEHATTTSPTGPAAANASGGDGSSASSGSGSAGASGSSSSSGSSGR